MAARNSRGGEPEEAAATLRRAVALWRGPALADVAEERFAQPEITRLEALRLACLADRIDADLACGRHEELVGELEALVQQHPHDERLRGRQMLALYHAGRQADALDAYRAAHKALRTGWASSRRPSCAGSRPRSCATTAPPAAPQEPPLPPDVRRRVTCVVVRPAFTGADPESLRARLERDRELASAACARHGGSVAEVRGEELLLAFGTPLAHEDDALRALRASLELRGDALALGVGTGDVVAPLIGEAPAAAERQARAAARGRRSGSTSRRGGSCATAPAPRSCRAARSCSTGLDADAPAILRRLDRPLVGRDEELARLRATFARVVSRRAPALLTIRGEPGIGKSRLAAELPALVGPEGRVLTGRCPSYGEGVTYWPLREMVDQARGERTMDALAAALGVEPAVGHQVAAAVGLAPGRAGDDPGWAFTRLIAALARAQPLVMVVDDAHLAEPALLELLVAVAGRIEDAPVLIVWVAGRTAARRRATYSSSARCPTRPARRCSKAAGWSRTSAVHVARAAGGNPLFLEQLVAYVGDHGATGLLPPALHALLAARLDRLDDARAVGAGDTARSWATRSSSSRPRARRRHDPRGARAGVGAAGGPGPAGAR